MKFLSNQPGRRNWLPCFLFIVGVIVAFKIILEIEVAIRWVSALFSIISPFAIGFVLAYILNIPVGRLQRLMAGSKNEFLVRRKKPLSVLLV